MTSSDAQAMGRIGEVITRTWPVAHVMKHVRGIWAAAAGRQLPGRRYVAKYTSTGHHHGVDHEIGSVEVGSCRPGVVGPRFFGVRLGGDQGGGIVSLPWVTPIVHPAPQPVLMRPALYWQRPLPRQSYVAPAASERVWPTTLAGSRAGAVRSTRRSARPR